MAKTEWRKLEGQGARNLPGQQVDSSSTELSVLLTKPRFSNMILTNRIYRLVSSNRKKRQINIISTKTHLPKVRKLGKYFGFYWNEVLQLQTRIYYSF